MSRSSDDAPRRDGHPLRRGYDTLPSPFRTLLHGAMQRLGVNAHLALLFDSPLHHWGWFDSYGDAPVDQHGGPLPWMPYSFIHFAESRFTESMRVFEYGSGNSTRWVADRVDTVVSVEHDAEWYDHVHTRAPENATIIHRDRPEYAEAVTEFGDFDVVIVDGIRRCDSVREAVHSLSNDGVIVFDDADRERYSAAYELLDECRFCRITHQGMGPYSSNLQTTATYYRGENCFGI